MSIDFNLFCLKSENPVAFWILLVVVFIGLCLVVAGIFQSFRRRYEVNSTAKVDLVERVKIRLSGPLLIGLIGLVIALAPFILWFFFPSEKYIAIDARSVPWKVGDLLEEVMRGHASSPAAGSVIVESAARQVEVQGFFTGDCAAEFFCKVCDASDELICERESLWKLSMSSCVHVRINHTKRDVQ